MFVVSIQDISLLLLRFVTGIIEIIGFWGPNEEQRGLEESTLILIVVYFVMFQQNQHMSDPPIQFTVFHSWCFLYCIISLLGPCCFGSSECS